MYCLVISRIFINVDSANVFIQFVELVPGLLWCLQSVFHVAMPGCCTEGRIDAPFVMDPAEAVTGGCSVPWTLRGLSTGSVVGGGVVRGVVC